MTAYFPDVATCNGKALILYLFKEKEAVLAMLWKDFTTNEINKKIQRENTIHLCDTIISAVKPFEYCLIIDDITNITPSSKKALERLKDCFIIIAAAREVKAVNTSFVWNFEKIDVKNLPRKEAFLLIHQLANNLEVENKELEFDQAAFGTIGLETLALVFINEAKKQGLTKIDNYLSHGAAQFLGIQLPELKVGEEMKGLVIVPDSHVYTSKEIVSKSKNSIFIGHTLKYKILGVFNGLNQSHGQ